MTVELVTASVNNENTTNSFSVNNIPKYGTLVPNRIFVGGISTNTTEQELYQLFSNYGNVKATKIILDRSGISKGYGFVTFESEEEAKRLQKDPENIIFKDRKLNIAPAIKKQSISNGTIVYHNTVPVACPNGVTVLTPNESYTFAQPAQAFPMNMIYSQPMYVSSQQLHYSVPSQAWASSPWRWTPPINFSQPTSSQFIYQTTSLQSNNNNTSNQQPISGQPNSVTALSHPQFMTVVAPSIQSQDYYPQFATVTTGISPPVIHTMSNGNNVYATIPVHCSEQCESNTTAESMHLEGSVYVSHRSDKECENCMIGACSKATGDLLHSLPHCNGHDAHISNKLFSNSNKITSIVGSNDSQSKEKQRVNIGRSSSGNQWRCSSSRKNAHNSNTNRIQSVPQLSTQNHTIYVAKPVNGLSSIVTVEKFSGMIDGSGDAPNVVMMPSHSLEKEIQDTTCQFHSLNL